MERCKIELNSSYEKCKTEEINIVNLLKNLLQKQKQLLDKIEAFDPEETVDNRAIILEATHINYMLFNKLFSLNIELESFWTRFNSCASKGILDLYVSNKELLSFEVPIKHNDQIQKQEEAENLFNLSSVEKEVANHTQEQDAVNLNTATKTKIQVPNLIELEDVCPLKGREIRKEEEERNEDESSSLNNKSTSSTSSSDNKSCSLENSSISNGPDKYLPSETTFSTVRNKGRVSQQISSGESSDSKNLDEFEQIPSKDIIPANNRSSPNQKDTTKPKHSFLNVKGSCSEKKLEHGKGRFERKYESVKSTMPDLSFSRDPDSSSEYYSLPDKEGPAKTVNGNIERINKLKKSATENFPVIMDHEMPNVNDLCIITYLSDPSEFYITLIGDDLIMSLSEQLKEIAKLRRHYFKNKLDAKLAIGQFCIAYSEEFDTWNRAEILNWQMTDAHFVEIRFVDFGEYASVRFQYLVPIPSCFCNLQKQAIRCQLAHSIPANGEKHWPLSATKYFEGQCYNRGDYLQFKIVYLAQEKNGVSIDLMKLEGNEVTLSEYMIISENAVKISQNDDEAETDSEPELGEDSESRKFMIEQIKHAQGIVHTDNPEEEFESFCNDLPETHETIADAMMGYNAQDDLRICKYTRRDGTCFKGPNCRLEHKQRRKGGITADTEEVCVAPDNSFMPNVNDKLVVTVTHCKSPGIIYGHVKLEENGNGKVMKDMFRAMNTKEVVKHYLPFKMNPSVGELVIAKNTDERWYRATVLELNATEWSRKPIVKVFLVDFGDIVDVSFENVRKIVSGFVNHPYQAIKFGISNIKALENINWTQFHEFMQIHASCKFTVTVTYAGADYIDGSFTDMQGNDFGQEMILKGFAEANTEDIHPLRSNRV